MNGVNDAKEVSVVGGLSHDERNAQKSYWTEHSLEATVEAMMLDSQAKVIDKEERPEASVSSALSSMSVPVGLTHVRTRTVVVFRPPSSA